jgi:hypothetical protein
VVFLNYCSQRSVVRKRTVLISQDLVRKAYFGTAGGPKSFTLRWSRLNRVSKLSVLQ